MNIKCILFWCLLITTQFTFANLNVNQEDDPILFSYGDESVTKSEFIYVYEKHNSQDKNQYSQESIDEYLRLYTNFKLKVKEAENVGIDTLEHIMPQLDQYYKQLAQSYLYDKEVSANLIREAYSRMTKEVKTSHILIRVNPDASPQDTALAYNKLAKIRKEIKSDEDFEKKAMIHSEDPSVKENKGMLGYITAFQTVYPFESAAYETQKGEVSDIIRTKFGYHLVKVHDIRAAKGRVLTAHILVKSKKIDTDDKKKAAKEKINQLYEQIKGGGDFAQRAKLQSEDKQTSNKGGELPWFGSGRMLPEYEDVAFKLKKEEVSKPFKTRLGWHIVKLLDKEEVGSFEEEEANIKKKSKRDARSKVSKQVFVKRLQSDYKFKSKPNKVAVFKDKKHEDIAKGRWKMSKAEGLSDVMFTMEIPDEGKVEYTQQHFARFIEKNQLKARSKTQNATVDLLYTRFIEQSLLQVEESRLSEKYPEFKRLLKEFRDGTLLFELTEQKVWNKALEDTVGLKEFYNGHKDNYKWKERVDAAVVTIQDPSSAKKIAKMMKKMKGDFKTLEATFNKNGAEKVLTVKEGKYESGQNEIKHNLFIKRMIFIKGQRRSFTGRKSRLRNRNISYFRNIIWFNS
ncbi:MAG: peptidylprolyl isomerase, partial [Chitinophagales bacterium]